MKHLKEAEKELAGCAFYKRDKHVIQFAIQSDPIGDVGVNGLQAFDLLVYVKNLIVSMNNVHPCRENSLTITKLEEAIHWQEARTKDRIERNVEGHNLD